MQLCLYCKEAHDSSHCPLYLKAQALFNQRKWKLSSSFSSAAPSPFIGHYGYPQVSVGVLSPPELVNDTWEYDAPEHWAVGNYQIPKIVDYRSSLVNSRQHLAIDSRDHRKLSVIQEVGMAKRPVDVDINLTKTPRFSVRSDGYSAPTGPRGLLKSMTATSNASVSTKVEKVHSDVDMKATDALSYLYKKGMHQHELMKILSVGAIGVDKRRKLVPTRWSITATDDIIGKQLHEQIKYHEVCDYQMYFGGYLGNYFCFLFFSRPWSYELFEMSLRTKGPLRWTTDFETTFGRKNYAQETAGGYYASRLPILEKFKSMKRQGSVLALRFITPEYTVPLGVWVVREACRKALQSKPVSYPSQKAMLDSVASFCKQRFNVDVRSVYQSSKMIKNFRQQSLTSFFG